MHALPSEGSKWTEQIMSRFEKGMGREREIDMLRGADQAGRGPYYLRGK